MKKNEKLPEGTEQEAQKILEAALSLSGMKLYELADKLGLTSPTVSASMNRKRMSLGTFTSYLKAMGYTVMVGQKEGEMFFPKWEVK